MNRPRKSDPTTRPAETMSKGRTVFINARLIDPASGRDEPGGLLVENGIIADGEVSL